MKQAKLLAYNVKRDIAVLIDGVIKLYIKKATTSPNFNTSISFHKKAWLNIYKIVIDKIGYIHRMKKNLYG